MNIAVFGMGYVGSVSAACLSAAGHRVVGVDVDAHKLAQIREGRAPVREPELDAGLAKSVACGLLTVTADTRDAVASSELSLICVGTPSDRHGRLDSSYLERVIVQIGEALRGSDRYHVVAVRSTLLPGLLVSRLIPLLARASGRVVGPELGVCVNPEFLREGSAISDFQNPPFTILGETDRRAGDVLLQAYSHIDAPVRRVKLDEASMVKYASNAYHAVKVAFANEIGILSRQLGVNGREVMQIFCEDPQLNISPKYLMPGFGFGGSCLPKDLRALNCLSKDSDLSTPLLSSVMAANAAHIQRVVDAVLDDGRRRVALLGLSFKKGSDDLRESPFVILAEALIGKGLRLGIFDPDILLGDLIGRNRAYMDDHLPHLAQIMAPDWQALIEDSEVVVIGKNVIDPAILASSVGPTRMVVDLVGLEPFVSAYRPWSAEG